MFEDKAHVLLLITFRYLFQASCIGGSRSYSERFLDNMNVETWVRDLVQWFEVSENCVLGFWSEGLFEKSSEVGEGVRVVRQSIE